MSKYQNYSHSLSAVEILSALTLLHNRLEEETHFKTPIPNNTLANSTHPSTHRKRHANQIGSIRKGEASDFYFGNHSSLAKSTTYPIFRFYSLSSRGYLADDQTTHIASTHSKDALSSMVEWEWITVPAYYAVYLRQKKSQRYLCFNRNGRPSMLRNPLFNRCLLRINALIRNPTPVSSNSPSSIRIDRSSSKSGVNSTRETPSTRYKRSYSSTKRFDNWLQPGLSNQQTNNLNSMPPKLATKLQWKHKIGNALLERIKRRSLQVPMPQLSWITTAAHLPVWRFRFCANGMPYIYRKPAHERCSHMDLPRLSDIFLICPPVPDECRIACSFETMSAPNLNQQNTIPQRKKPKCNNYCRHAITCRPPDQAALMSFSNHK